MAFIVKVPGVNSGGKTEGSERAGNAILKAIKEIHSNEKGAIIDADLFDLEEIHLDNSDLKLTNKLIYENSYEAYETKPRAIYLGGDHSISYSLTKSFLDYCRNEEKEPCIIIFDAHPDLISSSEFPGNRNWLRKLIENGFPTENILLVGVRNSMQEEIKFLNEKKIQKISVNSIIEDIQNIADTITEFANLRETYVSIDFDSIDPAFAPSVNMPEPGGISSRDFIYLIQRVNRIKNLRGVDIVEINLEKNGSEESVKLGAKILSELV